MTAATEPLKAASVVKRGERGIAAAVSADVKVQNQKSSAASSTPNMYSACIATYGKPALLRSVHAVASGRSRRSCWVYW